MRDASRLTGLDEVRTIGQAPGWWRVQGWTIPSEFVGKIRCMFGFLRGDPHDRAYRQIYAECCNYQRRWFGVDSLLFLSYESIFLYVLAVDAGACEGPPASAVTCCRLRSRTGNWPTFDLDLARFCSCFALLLASIKLDDDVRDDRSIMARLIRWRFRRRFATAKEYFKNLDPEFESRVDEFVTLHLELEQDSHGRIFLDDYVSPTAEAFAYAFGLFGKRLAQDAETCHLFEEVGNGIGAAIVAHDCAVDYPRDVRKGRFNPLHNQRDVRRAFEFSQRCLSQAGWECVRAFGEDSIAVRVARLNFDRLVHHQSVESRRGSHLNSDTLRLRKARWNLRHGDCDCPCDAGGCDGCDPSDSLSGCDCCFDCAADPCLCSDSTKSETGEKQRIAERADPSLVGMTGRVVGTLRPSGFVLLEDRKLPALTEGEWIDDGTEVVIVAEQSFGVTVRRKD